MTAKIPVVEDKPGSGATIAFHIDRIPAHVGVLLNQRAWGFASRIQRGAKTASRAPTTRY